MKELRLSYFRCYNDLTIKLKPGVNLLVGDNASGKTTILRACKYVLSSFFAGFKDKYTSWEGPSDEDYTVMVENEEGVELPRQEIEIGFKLFDTHYPTVYLNDNETINPSEFNNLYLKKGVSEYSKTQVIGIRKYRDYATLLRKNFYAEGRRNYGLPLFASFTTEDVHETRRISQVDFKKYIQKNSFGYFKCFDNNGLLKIWLNRLLVLVEAHKNLEEVTIVRDSIKKVCGEDGLNIITDIDIRPIKGEVYFKFVDGREASYDTLSDGYKRIVHIVINIAFRCALLNKDYYHEAATQQTRGTVLIDEIDMHLHPSLQSSVLKALHNAFPNLQFIVTTHAPLVMSGVKNDDNNSVLRMSYNNGQYKVETINPYGFDVSSIIRNFYNGVIPRDIEVQKKLDEINQLISDEKIDEASQLLQQMEDELGQNFPEISKLRTYLSFY